MIYEYLAKEGENGTIFHIFVRNELYFFFFKFSFNHSQLYTDLCDFLIMYMLFLYNVCVIFLQQQIESY